LRSIMKWLWQSVSRHWQGVSAKGSTQLRRNADEHWPLNAPLLAERMQNERLRQIIKELQRHRFGRRAETLPEDQMLLGLEDVEQAEANRPHATPTDFIGGPAWTRTRNQTVMSGLVPSRSW
jgi:hypothetical protein